MNSLLDAIGAIAMGGLLLLTIFTVLFNVRTTSYDINQHITLYKITNNVVDLIDHSYLSRVGAGVPIGDTVIVTATPWKFEFRGRLSALAPLSTITLVQEDSTDQGYPVKVQINGVTEYGPFFVADSIRMRYYYVDERETTVLDSIFAMRADLAFVAPSSTPDAGRTQLVNNIVFWKYFKNLYLLL